MSELRDDSQPPRFVWPPRAPGTVRDAPPATSVIGQLRDSEFEDSDLPDIGPRDPGLRASPAHPSVLASLEHTWLGLTTPPLHVRLADWSPDLPSAYCPRCGTTTGPFESTAAGCPACSHRRLPWERLIRLTEYRGIVRDMIHEVKFTRWRRLGDQLGRLLGAAVESEIARAGLRPDQFALVPIPSSFWRRISRGIDHATVITRGVSARTGIPVVHALTRSHRPSQVSLPANRRLSNVTGSIRAKRHVDFRDRCVILLDDVTTTRATLIAGCRALLARHKSLSDNDQTPPVRLWTAVLAVTPRSAGHAEFRPLDR